MLHAHPHTLLLHSFYTADSFIMSRAFDAAREAERKRKQKEETNRRVQEFQDKLSAKAMNCLVADSTTEVDKALLHVEIEGESFQFALKPTPVRLTHVSSSQHECFIPNASIAVQAMNWHHTVARNDEQHGGGKAGGPTVRCTIARNNRAPGATAPLKFAIEDELQWKVDDSTTTHTAGHQMFLAGSGWTIHFQYSYSTHDGKLRLLDAEYDTTIGEAFMRQLTEQTTQAAVAANAVGTKRKAAVEKAKERKLSKLQNEQKHQEDEQE